MSSKNIFLYKDFVPYKDKDTDGFVPFLRDFSLGNKSGAVIVCPGGGYCKRAEHEGVAIAEELNKAGISAFVLEYRVQPEHTDIPLNDALRAIRIVRSFGFEKVAIMGFSAGGHLTCSAATLYNDAVLCGDEYDKFSARPDAFIPCYAVVSMVSDSHIGSVTTLLKDKVDDHSVRQRFSAELNVNKDTPPAFIWHTSEDNLVPVENSLMLAAALSRYNIPYELHIYPHGYHGLGLAKGMDPVENWIDCCTAWLKRLGY